MGKLLTVNTGYSAVLLPSTNGYRNFNAGATDIVTDAEYAALPQATLNAVTVTTSGLPDPARKGYDTFAEPTTVQTFATLDGGVVTTGVNIVTGPAAGVTYAATGFMYLAPNAPGATPPVVGPMPGSSTDVELYHIQGAVVSVAPTAKSWFCFRKDTVTTNSTSPVVLDATVKATDFGKSVTGAGIPGSSFVGTVIPGVSFRLSSVQGSSTDVNASASATVVATVGGVVTKWPGGTVPTFTASVGAIDYFLFTTNDGGITYNNLLTVKGLA